MSACTAEVIRDYRHDNSDHSLMAQNFLRPLIPNSNMNISPQIAIVALKLLLKCYNSSEFKKELTNQQLADDANVGLSTAIRARNLLNKHGLILITRSIPKKIDGGGFTQKPNEYCLTQKATNYINQYYKNADYQSIGYSSVNTPKIYINKNINKKYPLADSASDFKKGTPAGADVHHDDNVIGVTCNSDDKIIRQATASNNNDDCVDSDCKDGKQHHDLQQTRFNSRRKKTKNLDDLKAEAPNIHHNLIELNYCLDEKSICDEMNFRYDEYIRTTNYNENAYLCLIVVYLLSKNSNVKIDNVEKYHGAILFKPKRTMIQYIFHAVAKANDKRQAEQMKTEREQEHEARKQVKSIIQAVNKRLKPLTAEEQERLLYPYINWHNRPRLTEEQDMMLVRASYRGELLRDYYFTNRPYNYDECKIALFFAEKS